MEEIMKLIEDRVKADNCDLVFDKSGRSLSDVQIVLHAKDSMDFSDDIITALNKSRAPSTGAVATPTPSSSLKH